MSGEKKKVSAKRGGAGGGKSHVATAVAVKKKEAAEDIDDVFSLLKGTRGSAKTSTVPLSTSAAVSKGAARGSKNSATAAGAGDAGKPQSGGLYRAPESTLEMSDETFFGSATNAGKRQSKAKKSSGGGAAADESLLKQEGVDRIVSMEELQGMLSNNSKAGTTPNCPFDCDCCF